MKLKNLAKLAYLLVLGGLIFAPSMVKVSATHTVAGTVNASVECLTLPQVKLSWTPQIVDQWQVYRSGTLVATLNGGASYTDYPPKGIYDYQVSGTGVAGTGGQHVYQNTVSNVGACGPLHVESAYITVNPGQVFTFSMRDHFSQGIVEDFPPDTTTGTCKRWEYLPGFKASLYNPVDNSLKDLPSEPVQNEWGMTNTPLKTGNYQYNSPAYDNRVATEFYTAYPDTYGANPPGLITQQRSVTAPTTPGTYQIRIQSGTITKYSEANHTAGVITMHCSNAMNVFPAEGDRGTQTISDDLESSTITLVVAQASTDRTATIKVNTNNDGAAWRFQGSQELCPTLEACSGRVKSYTVNKAQDYPTFKLEPRYPPFGYTEIELKSAYSGPTASKELRNYLSKLIKEVKAQSAGCNAKETCTLGPDGIATYTMNISTAPETCKVEVKGTFNGAAKVTNTQFSIKGPQNQAGIHDALTKSFNLLTDSSGALYTFDLPSQEVSIDGFESKVDKKGNSVIVPQTATCYPNQTITFNVPMISKAIIEVEY